MFFCCDADVLLAVISLSLLFSLVLSSFIMAIADVDAEISDSKFAFGWSFLRGEDDKCGVDAAVDIDEFDCDTCFNSKLPSR